MAAGFAQLLSAARLLMQALALALGLPEQFFRDRCLDPAARMCLFRYPPMAGGDEAAGTQRGCGAHTDCGFLTFVAQDAPGIEVRRWAPLGTAPCARCMPSWHDSLDLAANSPCCCHAACRCR